MNCDNAFEVVNETISNWDQNYLNNWNHVSQGSQSGNKNSTTGTNPHRIICRFLLNVILRYNRGCSLPTTFYKT